MNTDRSAVALRQFEEGPVMVPAPVNMPLAAVASLLKHGHSACVRLEPGDGTRYDLILVPTGNVCAKAVVASGGRSFLPAVNDRGPALFGWPQEYVVMATRVISGKPEGTAMVAPGMYWEKFDVLANGNDWTLSVLQWWFNELFLEMKLDF